MSRLWSLSKQRRLAYQVNYSIKMLEAVFFEDTWVHVVLKMSVVERYMNAVQLQASKELRVGFGEEVFEPLVEEELVFVFSEHFEHGFTVLRFMSWKASDEVFHADELSGDSWKCWWLCEHTDFIQPPMAAPRKMTDLPSPSTILSPLTLRKPAAMIELR